MADGRKVCWPALNFNFSFFSIDSRPKIKTSTIRSIQLQFFFSTRVLKWRCFTNGSAPLTSPGGFYFLDFTAVNGLFWFLSWSPFQELFYVRQRGKRGRELLFASWQIACPLSFSGCYIKFDGSHLPFFGSERERRPESRAAIWPYAEPDLADLASFQTCWPRRKKSGLLASSRKIRLFLASNSKFRKIWPHLLFSGLIPTYEHSLWNC